MSSLVGFVLPPAVALVAGVIVTLIGFRKRKAEADGAPNRWGAKYARFFKVGGPLLLLAALAWFVVIPLPDRWSRHATSDGACSAEFPESPQREFNPDGEEADRLRTALPDRNADYSLTFSDLSPADAARPHDDVFNDLRAIYGRSKGGPAPRLMTERVLTEGGTPGREYQFAVGDQFVTRIKVFVRGPRVYRAIAVHPPGAALDRDAQRFVDSFRFENAKP